MYCCRDLHFESLAFHSPGLRISRGYPGFEDKLKGGILSDEKVVADGNVITSRGPGTALLFALELVRYITGKDTGALSEQMIFSL